MNLYKADSSLKDVRKGLALCGLNICVESLNAYIEFALNAVERGAAPDMQYPIVSLE